MPTALQTKLVMQLYMLQSKTAANACNFSDPSFQIVDFLLLLLIFFAPHWQGQPVAEFHLLLVHTIWKLWESVSENTLPASLVQNFYKTCGLSVQDPPSPNPTVNPLTE